MSLFCQLPDRTEIGSTEYRDGRFRLILPDLQTGDYQCSIKVGPDSLRACIEYSFKRDVIKLDAIEMRFW